MIPMEPAKAVRSVLAFLVFRLLKLSASAVRNDIDDFPIFLCFGGSACVSSTSYGSVSERIFPSRRVTILGGRSSGRETIGRVAAGAVASLLLKELGISVCAYTKSIGPYTIDEKDYDFNAINQNPLYMPDQTIAEKAGQYLSDLMADCDSSGGMIECIASGLPVGLGEPVFNKLDALLSHAIMSIGAVKGVEIGDGFAVSHSVGSTNNDPFCIRDGKTVKKTNHSGGTLGGMSDGSDLILRAAVKPTPSIAATQHTVNEAGEEIDISIHGRHDPVIVPRAVVVVEAMTALTLADLLLCNTVSTIDKIKKVYEED